MAAISVRIRAVNDGIGRHGTLVVSLVWAAVGAAYLAIALTFPLGTVAAPGPGGYSVLVGMLLTLAALGSAAQVMWGRGGTTAAAQPDAETGAVPDADTVAAGAVSGRAGAARMAGMVGGALAYVVLVGLLGHLLSAFLAAVIVMRTQGDRRRLRIVGWALILSVTTYYGFAVILGIRLPGPPLVPGLQ